MPRIRSQIVSYLLLLALFVTGVVQAEEACQPSRWGADDEIGSANMVSPESVLLAAKLIKKGETHPLGIVIDPRMPSMAPRSMSMQVVQPGQHNGRSLVQDFGWDLVFNDDLAQLWFGTGSQLDGLGHLGESGHYYNCNRAEDFIDIGGLKKMGIHEIPPLVGRGVLLDMTRYFDVPAMEAGQGITADDIRQAAREQEVEIRPGDVVLFYTGWTDAKLASDPAAWISGEPGLTNAAAAYLATLSPMAVGSDTWGVEAVPPIEGDKIFYGHVTLLKEHGIYLLETMDTGRLARERVSEFMFVLGQARVKGAVQMIINPVALW